MMMIVVVVEILKGVGVYVLYDVDYVVGRGGGFSRSTFRAARRLRMMSQG